MICSITACNPLKKGDWEKTGRSLLRLDPDMYAYHDIIVLPNQGCEGCISSVENYVLTNFPELNATRIIFTRISSVKLLKIRMGDSIFHAPNVIIDSTNLFEFPQTEATIYPLFIKAENKKITDISVQSPENMH
ncbi:hypothetical protein [Leadbetterella sp. DM7]|uniref:hypothetical protein n=1 Tax=Leadbetterella sp. DM7 TaxID=3235085 RepID=UPI00349EFC85